MKIKIYLKTLVFSVLICGYFVNGQVGNPSVGIATLFEQYPVEIYTGLPKISIPLCSMPTHSKDINIDVSLNYHHASIKNSGFRSGNCGRGWYLSLGGVVQKIDKNSAVYSFNFMGLSGKIVLLPRSNGNNIAEITENKGPNLFAESFFSTGGTLQSINFYDDKGYKYVFNIADIINTPRDFPNDYIIDAKKMSFHLSDIYDTNNNLLAHFTYTANNDMVKINGLVKYDTVNTLNNVNITGYGSIVMNEEKLQDDIGAWHMYNGLVVKDFLNNEIKNVNFDYDIVFDYDEQVYTINKLYRTIISGVNNADPQNYNFYYRPTLIVNEDFSSFVTGYDTWGYPNTVSKYCKLNEEINKLVDVDNVMNGVLEKIQYPTGGCVIYEYEPNTYSYIGRDRIDLGNNGLPIPDFYYDEFNPENRHNFQHNELVNSINTNFTNQTQNEYFYIKLHGEPTIETFPGGGLAYPSFVLKNVSAGSSVPLLMSDNDENNCLGHLQYLPAGYTWRIEKGINGINTEVSVYSISRKPTVNKFWYGGGIRVKTIAYFNEDAPQDFFYSSTPANVSPAKSTFYNYNSFSDPSMSSGCMLYSGDEFGDPNIIYSNVSVSDRISDNRTEYTFFTPIDYEEVYSKSSYTYGKLKNKKIYNSQNILQQETTISYTTLQSDDTNAGTDEYEMGWMMPSQYLTNEYLGSTLQTKINYEYNASRNIQKKTESTSRSSESLVTNYYYHLDANGNPYATNRVGVIDHIDQLVGTTLLGTSKISYSNSWTDSQGNNTSYLPSQILSSKGTGSLVVKTRNNKYDLYGNLLESQQENGLTKSFVWGYNNTMIIAEITGIAYSSIPASLINAAKTASDSGSETNLLTALTNLRNASQVSAGLITTYTYKPLIGISTVTDPRGYKITYEYDSNGRQKAVKDQEGNIITENIYHSIPQN